MSKQWGQQQGSALLVALLSALAVSITVVFVLQMNQNSEELSRLPRIKSAMSRIETTAIQQLYSGNMVIACAEDPNQPCVNHPFVSTLNAKIYGKECAAKGGCFARVENARIESGRLLADVTYTGDGIAVKPLAISQQLTQEMWRTNIVRCPLATPFMTGLKPDGTIECASLPAGCGTGQFMQEFDLFTLSTGLPSVLKCSQITEEIRCPAGQFLGSLNWNDSTGQVVGTCRAYVSAFSMTALGPNPISTTTMAASSFTQPVWPASTTTTTTTTTLPPSTSSSSTTSSTSSTSSTSTTLPAPCTWAMSSDSTAPDAGGGPSYWETLVVNGATICNRVSPHCAQTLGDFTPAAGDTANVESWGGGNVHVDISYVADCSGTTTTSSTTSSTTTTSTTTTVPPACSANWLVTEWTEEDPACIGVTFGNAAVNAIRSLSGTTCTYGDAPRGAVACYKSILQTNIQAECLCVGSTTTTPVTSSTTSTTTTTTLPPSGCWGDPNHTPYSLELPITCTYAGTCSPIGAKYPTTGYIKCNEPGNPLAAGYHVYCINPTALPGEVGGCALSAVETTTSTTTSTTTTTTTTLPTSDGVWVSTTYSAATYCGDLYGKTDRYNPNGLPCTKPNKCMHKEVDKDNKFTNYFTHICE